MLFLTHISAGLALSMLVFPHLYVAVLIGSILPDIDLATSTIGRRFKIIGWVFAHRGFFHTMWAGIILSAMIGIISYSYALAFLAGYILHLILDGLTPKGVVLFNPFLRLKGPFKTGSIMDYVLLGVFLIIISINLL